MLIEKFFSLRKTEAISMDAHLTEVKEVANLLEEVEVIIPKDIIVYYTLENLPKEYEIFKRMQMAAQSLPTYEQLEAKLISEETSIRMENQHKEEGEALFSHHDRFRKPPNQRYASAASGSYFDRSRRSPDSGGVSAPCFLQSPENSGPTAPRFSQPPRYNNSSYSQTRGPTQPAYQPRYRPRGPERPRNAKCNFCGLEGHFERECDLRSILDRIKDYEHRLMQ